MHKNIRLACCVGFYCNIFVSNQRFASMPGDNFAYYSARQRGMQGLVSEQTMYTLLCRWPEIEVLPAARDLGIGVVPYMPLAGGILTAKVQSEEGSRTAFVENDYGISAGGDLIRDFQSLCADLGESPVAVAIAWTLANPALSSAIVGARTPAHLDNLKHAGDLELDEETLKRLDELFDTNKGRPIRTAKPAPEAYAW